MCVFQAVFDCVVNSLKNGSNILVVYLLYVCILGCVRLCGELPEERVEHPDRVPAVCVYFRLCSTVYSLKNVSNIRVPAVCVYFRLCSTVW